MSALLGVIFLFWFLGAFFAYWIYSGEGEWDYIRGRFDHTYTDGQAAVYSMTWFIWLTRFIFRVFVDMCRIIIRGIRYACVEVWHKWRDG